MARKPYRGYERGGELMVIQRYSTTLAALLFQTLLIFCVSFSNEQCFLDQVVASSPASVEVVHQLALRIIIVFFNLLTRQSGDLFEELLANIVWQGAAVEMVDTPLEAFLRLP